MTSMNDDDPSEDTDIAIERRLADLREEHKDLDDAIRALEERYQPDMLQIARLKKKKLSLKDEIGRLEDQLTPDIIA
ncbi:YdcH family protein [Caulobacter segnis]